MDLSVSAAEALAQWRCTAPCGTARQPWSEMRTCTFAAVMQNHLRRFARQPGDGWRLRDGEGLAGREHGERREHARRGALSA